MSWRPFTVKYNASVNQFRYLFFAENQPTLEQIDLNGNQVNRVVVTE